MSLSLSSVRRRLYHNLFDLTTRSSRRFEGLCALFALLSVLVIFVESGVGTEYHLTFDEWHIFVWLELCVTLIFTGEYLLRLFSWPEPAKYVFSFWGFIDLVTILPLYVMWLWPEISLNYMFAGALCERFACCVFLNCYVLCHPCAYSGAPLLARVISLFCSIHLLRS